MGLSGKKMKRRNKTEKPTVIRSKNPQLRTKREKKMKTALRKRSTRRRLRLNQMLIGARSTLRRD
jgi:hypothetical protein